MAGKSAARWGPIPLGLFFGAAVGIALDQVFFGAIIGLLVGIVVSTVANGRGSAREA